MGRGGCVLLFMSSFMVINKCADTTTTQLNKFIMEEEEGGSQATVIFSLRELLKGQFRECRRS